MEVNGCWDFEAQKSVAIHHKKVLDTASGVNKGLLEWIDAFVLEKYPYLKLYKPLSPASANCRTWQNL